MVKTLIDLDDQINTDNIPAIPDVARRLLEFHRASQVSREELDEVLKTYPEFFAQLLEVINSDHFNLTTKVASIPQAIELAGFNKVCQLMLCLVVHRSFSHITIRGLDQQEFWEDSLRRAVSARMIGEVIGLDAGLCFTAAFVQDLGFLLLFLLSPNKGMLWNEFRKREPDARYSMERNIFNMNHDEAMQLFCDKWDLVDVVAQPVIAHHRCDQLQDPLDQQLCEVLNAADWMAAVYTAVDKSFVISRCRQLLSEQFEMERYRTEEFLAAIPDEVEITSLVLGVHVKEHIKFSQVLYEANIKLTEDNLNFQELTLRLEQAIEERDRLAAELNKEINLAKEIQRSLLPGEMDSEFPVVGINISARELSGDFYDYFRLPDGRIYFTLGDVSGKGVNAALLMAKTSSLFRCLGKRIDAPAELLSEINRELWETSIHGMFVTMIAGLYDENSDELKLVNAGNPPALLMSPDELGYEIEAQGPPLGVVPEIDYGEHTMKLGDNSLYIFSDGVTEGFIADGVMLGMAGLFKSLIEMDKGLSPSQRLQKIVGRFRYNSAPVRDDITLLLLERSHR